jgi:hypothetical protein
MPKLYELLAVENSTKGQAAKTCGELTTTFEKKRHLFEGRKKTFISNEENTEPVTEEQQEIQTTVRKEIRWISEYLAAAVDLTLQVDAANTQAKADVVNEEGAVLLKDVPATTLLNLEKHRLPEWKKLIEAIPTLDPAKSFQADKEHGEGHYKARDVRKTRTKKINEVITLAPPTDKHPAQVQLVQVDKAIGEILEQEWSGLITPTDKATLLDRVEALSRAVSKARSKANDHEIVTADKKIGAKLLEFVFSGLTGA